MVSSNGIAPSSISNNLLFTGVLAPLVTSSSKIWNTSKCSLIFHPVILRVVFNVLGWSTGLIRERLHYTPLSLITKSGVIPTPWIDQELTIHNQEETYHRTVPVGEQGDY